MTTSYKSVHRRIARKYGPAREHLCIGCLGPAYEWAYLHTGSVEVRSPDGAVYTLDWDGNYAPMCRKCHRALDWQADPVYSERMRRSLSANGSKQGPKNKDLLSRLRTPEHQSVAGRMGGLVGGKKGGRAVSQLRRRCDECGLEASPGTIAAHQKAKDHHGKTVLS